MNIKSKQNGVRNYWIYYLDNFSVSPLKFYDCVEDAIADRKIPGIEITRVEFAEGGILSDRRIYLRMMRKRLAIDFCAAPFGTGYIFSCRTISVPAVIKFRQNFFGLGLLLATFKLLNHYSINPLLPLVAGLGLILIIILISRKKVLLGLRDTDALLLNIPAIGLIYERFFRKETHSSLDTRLIYLNAVPILIRKLVEEFTGANGIKLVKSKMPVPISTELYRPIQKSAKAPDLNL